MRFAVLAGIIALNGAWAADPFAGDWKLNSAKSEFKDRVKAGRVLIEADNAGGYRQLYEIIFEAAPALRLTSRSQFDGSVEETTHDGQDVRYTSRRIDPNAFEVTYRDRDTNRVNRTMRFSVEPRDHTLTVLTTGARAVFDRLGEGPLLEPGKSVEQTFGPGAVSRTASACRPANSAQAGLSRRRAESTGHSTVLMAHASITSAGRPRRSGPSDWRRRSLESTRSPCGLRRRRPRASRSRWNPSFQPASGCPRRRRTRPRRSSPVRASPRCGSQWRLGIAMRWQPSGARSKRRARRFSSAPKATTTTRW